MANMVTKSTADSRTCSCKTTKESRGWDRAEKDRGSPGAEHNGSKQRSSYNEEDRSRPRAETSRFRGGKGERDERKRVMRQKVLDMSGNRINVDIL